MSEICQMDVSWHRGELNKARAELQATILARVEGLLCGENDGCVKDDGNHCSHINDALQAIREVTL